jgi:hypothetical protein
MLKCVCGMLVLAVFEHVALDPPKAALGDDNAGLALYISDLLAGHHPTLMDAVQPSAAVA